MGTMVRRYVSAVVVAVEQSPLVAGFELATGSAALHNSRLHGQHVQNDGTVSRLLTPADKTACLRLTCAHLHALHPPRSNDAPRKSGAEGHVPHGQRHRVWEVWEGGLEGVKGVMVMRDARFRPAGAVGSAAGSRPCATLAAATVQLQPAGQAAH